MKTEVYANNLFQIFLFFIGAVFLIMSVTHTHQKPLKIKEELHCAHFASKITKLTS